MATPKVPEQISDWTTLRDTLAPRLEELRFLQPLHAGLSELLAELTQLEADQEVVLARLHTINERRRELVVLLQELTSQIHDALRGRYGSRSQTLREFGVKPRSGGRPRGRRKAAAEPAAELAP